MFVLLELTHFGLEFSLPLRGLLGLDLVRSLLVLDLLLKLLGAVQIVGL